MRLTLWNIHYIAKRLNVAAYDASVAAPIDPPLTPGESSVLEYLMEQKDYQPIGEVVRNTGIAQSWVSTVVKSLVERGWAETGKDETDRRVTTVRATDWVKREAKKVLGRDAGIALTPLLRGGGATEEEIKSIEKGLVILLDVFKRKEGAELKSDVFDP